jgi:hypothetical protein
MNKLHNPSMTRRRFIGSSSILLLPIVGGISFSACQGGENSKYYSQFAFILAYLLFGENPPKEEQEKIKNALRETAGESAQIQGNLRKIFDKISTIRTLDIDAREEYFQLAMPQITESPEILMVLAKYFEGNSILDYMDYPDMPGDYGWCGYLVQDGKIWDRYYPK